MGQSAQEFISVAKAKAREDYEKKRDAHLIRLGLVDKEKKSIQYSRYQTAEYTTWDPEKQMYFGTVCSPIEVTDEEYEEIKRLTEDKSKETLDMSNGAESFLNVILIISLIIGIIAALGLFITGSIQYRGGGIYMLGGAAMLITSLVNFAVGKVVLNISNNLHSINAKTK